MGAPGTVHATLSGLKASGVGKNRALNSKFRSVCEGRDHFRRLIHPLRECFLRIRSAVGIQQTLKVASGHWFVTDAFYKSDEPGACTPLIASCVLEDDGITLPTGVETG